MKKSPTASPWPPARAARWNTRWPSSETRSRRARPAQKSTARGTEPPLSDEQAGHTRKGMENRRLTVCQPKQHRPGQSTGQGKAAARAKHRPGQSAAGAKRGAGGGAAVLAGRAGLCSLGNRPKTRRTESAACKAACPARDIWTQQAFFRRERSPAAHRSRVKKAKRAGPPLPPTQPSPDGGGRPRGGLPLSLGTLLPIFLQSPGVHAGAGGELETEDTHERA